MKPQVIYIVGLGHSGSTILQYLLAGHPLVVGLGEVRKLAEGHGWHNEAGNCSCGLEVASCPLWRHLRLIQNESTVEWYKRLAGKVSSLYPNASHWIDSSKSIHSIHPWLKLEHQNLIEGLRVIFLVRDVRGWAVSDETTRKRKGRTSRSISLSMLYWWKTQKRILHLLKKNSVGFQIVSYESLIFQTDAQLSRIAAFSEIEETEENWIDSLKEAVVHDVFGNRMKNNTSKRTRLTYDDRWQYRMSANLLPVLYPIWKLNSELRRQGGV
ncbi:MAG: sulfotransferase [Desulfobacteraceae bacterium]|nr:sulfotransferase [Desulfobacteraceae bacterium]